MTTASIPRPVDYLASLLAEVRLATDDWIAMRARLHSAITSLGLDHPPLSDKQLGETIAFLQWLDEGNFVFLGTREYSYAGAFDGPVEEPSQASGLGLLRDPTMTVLRRGSEMVTLPTGEGPLRAVMPAHHHDHEQAP